MIPPKPIFNWVYKRNKEKPIGLGEKSFPYLDDMVKKSMNEVLIVVGELDPSLYEDTPLIDSIRDSLERGVNYHIIFHKDDDDFEEARKVLLKENPKMMSLLEKYPERLHLYWREERLKNHFMLSDRKTIFREEPHEAYGGRRALVRENLSRGDTVADTFFRSLTQSDYHQVS